MIKKDLKILSICKSTITMNTTEKLKLVVSRIIEANTIRELLNRDKLNETLAELPNILEALKESVSINTNRFEQSYVDPIALSRLPQLNQLLAQAGPEELDNIANTALFIMEREIFSISKKILEDQ
jgi:hypothetical protein